MKNKLLILLFLSASWSIDAQQAFSMDEAVEYALEQHPTIRKGNLDVFNAEHEIKKFRAIGMPKVNGAVDYSYYYYVPKQPVEDFIGPAVYGILAAEGLPTTTQGPPETFEFSFVQPQQLNVGVSANMLVFDGSYLYGLKAARLYRELVKKQTNITETNIKTNVTKAYLAILIAEENKSTIEDNITTLSKSLDDVKAMYEAGFMESLDVDRLQLSYDNLNTQLQNIDGLILLSKNLLKFQMNYPLDDPIDLSQTIDDLVIQLDADMLSDQIEIDPGNRAEYQVLNTSQELNNLNLKRNKAGYYPSVGAFASFQESLQRRNLFSGDETGFLPTGVLGLNIAIPIYDGGEKSAKIQQVKIDIEKTEIQKEEFATTMTLQVRNAQIAMQNAKRNLENRKNALMMNESIFDRTKIKFNEGVGSSVEVTQAESSLYNAQAELISAYYDLLQAKVDLDIALGTL